MSTLKVTNLQHGSATAPAISVAVGGGATVLGITTFHNGVDSSERLTIGGSNVTDSNLLTLNGSGATQNVGLVINKTNSPARAHGIQVNNGTGDLIFYDYTVSAERLRIDTNGYVDIQTGIFGDNPSDNFTLNGRIQPHYGFNLVPETGVPIGISGYRGIAFASSGTERMRITEGGLVGIGITTPEKLLEVSSSSSPTIRINNSDGSISADQTIGAVEFKANDGSGDGSQVTGSIESISQAAFTGQGSPSHLIFKTNGVSGAGALAERLRITHDGEVGVGANNPQATLQVGAGFDSGNPQQHGTLLISADNSLHNYIRFTNGGGTESHYPSGIWYQPAGRMELRAASSSTASNAAQLVLASDGNIGLNKTAPADRLHVGGKIRFGNNNTYYGVIEHEEGTTGANIYTSVDSGGHIFKKSTTTQMIIKSSGFVGINEESPGAQLAVKRTNTATSGLNGVLKLKNGSATNGNRASLLFSSLDDHDVAAVNGTILTHAGSASNNEGQLEFWTKESGNSITERVRIRSNGHVQMGGYLNATTYHRINGINASGGDTVFVVSGYQTSGGTNQDSLVVTASADSAGVNPAVSTVRVFRHASNQRSINAAGSINASGNDYAEYMTKAGNFTLAKGAICGVNPEGKLTNVFADAISFAVKSTDPSYVGGDTWHGVAGEQPGGYGDTRTEEEIAAAKVVYEEALESARQLVDRIAFSGQVPVNVTGATPGQHIIPTAASDGSIEGTAKAEADLTMAEYMSSVGKVIAIEDDGRARIIVKVA